MKKPQRIEMAGANRATYHYNAPIIGLLCILKQIRIILQKILST
ncbi:hypothetical protein BN8_03204 [Fibrisoma limi BUZ 3]|uniref:Uncharacterized protein n=1 Tax=Fibrisoma limi BUZ 3 TaxID=1185876 RepID=I2GJI8_9BACT|nr:hypothetical protein BN8_03204 [Fibrisoma limi BUZ 3]